MRIVMVGSGYVGLVSGACFSDFGHEVVCVDKDATKIDGLKAGESYDLQLFGGVGYQYIEDDFNGTDWRLGATVTVKGVDFTVAYTDTDYSARECGNNQCDAKVVFTVGMEF